MKRKDLESKSGGDGDSLLHNAELAAGVVSSILKDFDLKRSNALPVDEALALSLQGVASVSSYILSCLFPFDLNIGLVLDVDSMLDVQVATHLKGLAKKAKLNERHVKAARVYKARVASLTTERTELQERVQRMTEEMERLKSDLKHTMSARARAESREDEVRNSLTASFGRSGVSCGSREMTWLRPGMGCNLSSMSFRWLGMSSLHPGASCGNLKRSYVRPVLGLKVERMKLEIA